MRGPCIHLEIQEAHVTACSSVAPFKERQMVLVTMYLLVRGGWAPRTSSVGGNKLG